MITSTLSLLQVKEMAKTKRQKFIEQFGEDPEDMFGPDWENYIDEYLQSEVKK